MKIKTQYIVIISCVVCFFIGFFINKWYIGDRNDGTFKQLRQNSLNKTAYQFIDPLLGCSITPKFSDEEFRSLKQEILGFIDDTVTADNADKVSVYFDTRDGRWLGINTKEKYSPASLFKVPFMIAILKKAELNPSILNKELTYHKGVNLNQSEYFASENSLRDGYVYNTSQLLEYLIHYSDNNTVPLLNQIISENDLSNIAKDFGIHLTSTDVQDDFINVSSYANFFRILYNSSYLNRDMSEKALAYMSSNDFKAGIRSGIPDGLVITSKFGERTFVNSDNKELHDCGIIYYPDHPYLLCVMTKGNNFDNLAKTISGISKIVYNYIST